MNAIDFFDKMRFWGSKRNAILNKLKIYGIINHSVALAANAILPSVFKLTQNRENNRLGTKVKKPEKVIVSLTSYPVRIPTLWLTIESILRQSVKPDTIVLYLTESQVGEIEKLPQSLLRLRKRGLEIRLCKEEIRSHTKYYQAFQDFPDDLVITVDDDLFYRSDLIENHIKWHREYPHAIIANWAKDILKSTPYYKDWPDVEKAGISEHYLLLGVGSVLYPPHCMYKDIFDTSLIKSLCLTADDVWLSCMALLKHTPIYFTKYKYNFYQMHLSHALCNHNFFYWPCHKHPIIPYD